MAERIPQPVLDQLFLHARTQNKWLSKDVTEAQLREIIEIMRMGPTSANTQPARFVFLKSEAAKERLKPFLSEGNRDKTISAPVCCIVAHDMKFYENLPRTFPHRPQAKDGFIGKDAHVLATAFRNGTLQGAYLMLAARSVGLDVGAMSGFDNAGVDKEFFAGTEWRSNFLVNIGHGDPTGVMQRLPRLSFDEYAKIYDVVAQASQLTMNVLVFDTCFSAVSVAVRVTRGEQSRVASAFDLMETGHAEALMPMIDRVMRKAQLAFGEIDRIVVTNGPGTFTGVRTGVAAARGLALATGAEIVAMSSLWAIARSAVAEPHPTGRLDPARDAMLVVMDARKGQVFAQVVDADGTELTSPLLLNLDDATTLCSNRRLIVIGDRASAVVENSRLWDSKIELCQRLASDAAFIRPDALSLIDVAGRSSITSPLLPLYFRPPDAKPQGDKSLPWSSR